MELLGDSNEYNMKRRPYHGKIVVPPVRNQHEHSTPTCFIHSSCTCVESLYKRQGALANPQKDFEVIFSENHLIEKYEKAYGVIGEELDNKTGFSRLLRTLGIIRDSGVTGYNDEEFFGPFKIGSFKEVNPVYRPRSTKTNPNPKWSLSKSVKDLLIRGHVLVGTFRISTNYMKLKPGDIYTYNKKNPSRIDGRICSHAVAIIGYGERGGVWYFIYQNSGGEGWGEKGIGRVNMESITHLVHVKL
ncbi:hypothetical protein ACP70R_019578 [Stipagrostis hirtigluma subsp. patula]